MVSNSNFFISFTPPVYLFKSDSLPLSLLVDESEIHPEMGPLFLKTTYLKDQNYVETSNLYESMLRTPGERRPIDKKVIEHAIMDGVLNGEFGIGELVNGVPVSKFFKKSTQVSFESGEIILQASLCEEESEYFCDQCDYKSSSKEELDSHHESHTKPMDGEPEVPLDDSKTNLNFGFTVPEGQINNISQMLLKIASHYKDLTLKVEADHGKMTKHDLDLIKETLRQIGSHSDLL